MEFGKRTDTGLVRRLNEDNCMVNNDGDVQFIIVADGMGGHNAGEVASEIAITVVADAFKNKQTVTIQQIREAVEAANSSVYRRALSDMSCNGMGTTIVLAVLTPIGLVIANVGDSRAYYFDSSKEKLTKISIDHSLVEELLSVGKLTPEEVEKYPYKNVITRAIGTSPTVKTDIFDIEWYKEDVILLCSDGLTLHVDEKTIERQLSEKMSVQQMCDKLVDLALKGGGRDNISVAIARNIAGGERDE